LWNCKKLEMWYLLYNQCFVFVLFFNIAFVWNCYGLWLQFLFIKALCLWLITVIISQRALFRESSSVWNCSMLYSSFISHVPWEIHSRAVSFEMPPQPTWNYPISPHHMTAAWQSCLLSPVGAGLTVLDHVVLWTHVASFSFIGDLGGILFKLLTIL
jgi:hypothetical protein